MTNDMFVRKITNIKSKVDPSEFYSNFRVKDDLFERLTKQKGIEGRNLKSVYAYLV